MDQDLIQVLLKMCGATTQNKDEHYDEIKKLDDLLNQANIPHDFHPFMGGFQVTYYGKKGKPEAEPGTILGPGFGAICSAVEHSFSYGHENDTIEISGLMTKEEYESTGDSVLGNLSAEDVFTRIKKHWETNDAD